MNYPEANPAANAFDETLPQNMFKDAFEALGLAADSDMTTFKSKDFSNIKPAFGHESDGLVKVCMVHTVWIKSDIYYNIYDIYVLCI